MPELNGGLSAGTVRDPGPCCAGEKEYTPRRGDLLRNHEINIRFLSTGCIIRVGCKEIPFESIKEGMDELNEYVKDPYQSVKRWDEIFNKNE